MIFQEKNTEYRDFEEKNHGILPFARHFLKEKAGSLRKKGANGRIRAHLGSFPGILGAFSEDLATFRANEEQISGSSLGKGSRFGLFSREFHL